jgi:hypothetical protein
MKDIEMSRRNKWIIIVVIIGFLSCGIAMVVFDLGYGAIRIFSEQKRMESRRPVLLYQTDHRELHEACRELSKQVVAGELKIDQYRFYRFMGNPDPETQLFPRSILDLKPFQVYIEKNGCIDLIMSPTVMYGVRAHPDGLKHGNIELVPGLWYFDEDFRVHPEHKKEIEDLLKKRKSGDSSSMP